MLMKFMFRCVDRHHRAAAAEAAAAAAARTVRLLSAD